MFTIPTPVLIQSLDMLRQQLCAYGPAAKRCDCKYRRDGGPLSQRFMGQGEVTGCAELRLAIELLRKADYVIKLAEGVQREAEERASRCARCGARVGRSLCVGCS